MAQRDHRAAYKRRIARGLAKGLTRSQARGHPKAAERHASPKAAERLRHFVQGLDFVERHGRRYSVGEDPWIRNVVFLSGGRRVKRAVQGYEQARRIGLHWEAIHEFKNTNDPAYLAPFVGAQITD